MFSIDLFWYLAQFVRLRLNIARHGVGHAVLMLMCLPVTFKEVTIVAGMNGWRLVEARTRAEHNGGARGSRRLSQAESKVHRRPIVRFPEVPMVVSR